MLKRGYIRGDMAGGRGMGVLSGEWYGGIDRGSFKGSNLTPIKITIQSNVIYPLQKMRS